MRLITNGRYHVVGWITTLTTPKTVAKPMVGATWLGHNGCNTKKKKKCFDIAHAIIFSFSAGFPSFFLGFFCFFCFRPRAQVTLASRRKTSHIFRPESAYPPKSIPAISAHLSFRGTGHAWDQEWVSLGGSTKTIS